jgi:L-ascorbate metabolism protein UlaG (beta-lactamase superfamily)
MERRDFIKGIGLGALAAGLGKSVRAQEARAPGEAPGKAAEKAPPSAGDDFKITFLGTSHGNPTLERFNSSTLLEFGGKKYLIDAGEPVSALLVRHRISPADIDGIFITYPHGDHMGGLVMQFVQMASFRRHDKDKYQDRRCQVLLPGDDVKKSIADTMRILRFGRGIPDYCDAIGFGDGVIFEDGGLRVTAIGNDHMKRRADGSARAYSFLFEGAGKRIVFSGDLSNTFDFPYAVIEPGLDLIVCELVHFPVKLVVEGLRDKAIKHGCFQHASNHYCDVVHGKERFAAFSKQLTFPAELVDDGTVRTV